MKLQKAAAISHGISRLLVNERVEAPKIKSVWLDSEMSNTVNNETMNAIQLSLLFDIPSLTLLIYWYARSIF